jgi:Flp pilus assembly protein CpaB
MRSALLLRTRSARAGRWTPCVDATLLRIVGAAVLGGLALATLVASGSHLAEPGGGTEALVVIRPIPEGAAIVASDLGRATVDVPSIATSELVSPALALGARARVTIQPGTLLVRPLIQHTPPAPPTRSITIAVPATAVAPGMLAPGNRVDVVAAETAIGGQTTTLTLATQLRVVGVSSTSGDELVTVSTPTLETALAIAQALATGKVDVVDATGVSHDASLATYPPSIGNLATHG